MRCPECESARLPRDTAEAELVVAVAPDIEPLLELAGLVENPAQREQLLRRAAELVTS